MLFIKYLILNNRIFVFIYFNKNFSSCALFLLKRVMFLKFTYNWLDFSLYFKEFFYDCGFLK